MAEDELDRERLECACVAVSKVLHELLRERKLSALEFLSIVGHLPVKLADLNSNKWKF